LAYAARIAASFPGVADEIFSFSVVVAVTAAKRITANTAGVAVADASVAVTVTVLGGATSTAVTSVVEL
jgi:hypothetical protein